MSCGIAFPVYDPSAQPIDRIGFISLIRGFRVMHSHFIETAQHHRTSESGRHVEPKAPRQGPLRPNAHIAKTP